MSQSDHQAQAGKVRIDFDRIALLPEGWNHNAAYHDFLLRHMPVPCEAAFDIGCGTGAFSRVLAQRADRVLAIDLSPHMIDLARERSDQPSIDYQVSDAMVDNFPAETFDCVVSLATLHHLPLAAMLSKMIACLKPGGRLLILDLYEPEGARDFLATLAAIPVSLALKLYHSGRLRESREARAAWAEHGKSDSYLTMREIRQICGEVLPDAQIRQHLLWRYSIIWEKL